MNHLLVRLALVMVAVALLPLGLNLTLQTLSFERQYRQLPAGLKRSVERTLSDPDRLDRPYGEPARLPARWRTLYGERPTLVRTFAEDFRAARRRILIVSGLASATLGLLLAGVLSQQIARPIAAVSHTAERLRRGELHARVALDLTYADQETRELAKNVNTLAETLARNETERKHMIADIAHDLRTPLAVMQAKLAAIEDDILPLDRAEVRKLYKQTEQLAALIADLRLLSLAEASRLELQPATVNLGDLVASLVEDFQIEAANRGVALDFQPANLPTYLQLDPDKIRRVLANLLDNALKYTPRGGAVTVTLSDQARSVTLTVADTGPGLSAAVLERAFGRFYRGERQAGSGLGLAVVHALVRLHEGEVRVANGGLGGAVFTVVLPKQRDLSPTA